MYGKKSVIWVFCMVDLFAWFCYNGKHSIKKENIPMDNKLLLIDGNSIVFRAFFAMHNQMDKFTNKDGLHTAAIYGFKLMLDHV